MLKRLWNDECGAVVSAELVLLLTILGIGMVVGLKAVQSAVVDELGEIGTALNTVNQNYSYAGSSLAGCAVSGGTNVTDVAEVRAALECDGAAAIIAVGAAD